MPEYQLDLDAPAGRRKKKRWLGCSIVGWAAFFTAMVLIGLIGYRTWNYTIKIRSGEDIILPQFTGRLTAPGQLRGLPLPSVDRADLEDPNNPTLGLESSDAKLTIVQFGDFECPFSKDEHTIVRGLMRKYGDRVRFIYRDYPIESIHPSAFQASLAAECAREQGRFWAYHDKLYGNSPVLGFQDLLRYAEQAGLDARQFERCLIDERYKDDINGDITAASGFGVRGTPTFFFNGRRVEGAIPPQDFERLIDRMLQ